MSWKQLVVFTVEVILFPHVAVCVVAVYWLPVHPWVGVPLLVHCGIAMVQELLSVYNVLSVIPYLQPLAAARYDIVLPSHCSFFTHILINLQVMATHWY